MARIMRGCLCIASGLCFLGVLGSVGAIELGSVGLGQGIAQSVVFLALCVIFGKLGGAFR